MAAVLFTGSGLITFVSLTLPLARIERVETALVASIASATGAIVWFAPWRRWPQRTSLLLIPVALALITWGNTVGGHDPYDYGLFFVALFVWIGVAHRRWTSTKFAPLATVAYVLPFLLRAQPASGLPTVLVAIPVAVMIGETIAWVTTRLEVSEEDNELLMYALDEKSRMVDRLRELEHQLRDSEERHRTLIEQMPAVTYIDRPDERSTALYISPQVRGLLGYAPRQWLEQPELWVRLLHEEDAPRILRAHRESNRTGDPFHEEYRMLARDGRSVWVRDEALLVGSGDSRVWQGILIDITERKEAEEQLEFLAYHDRLTGLPNRGLFEEHLHLAIARARRSRAYLGVLSIDLNRFKAVNDTLGHASGDEYLHAVAARIRESVREVDLVARVGGDEFLVLLPDLQVDAADEAPQEHVAHLVERLRERVVEAVARPLTVSDVQFHPSVSIGTAIFPLDALDEQDLLRAADRSMYRNKHRREPPDRRRTAAAAKRELSLQQRLRVAADEEAWLLRFQPIRELVCGRLVGAEALLRARDPVIASVGAEVFVPIAEELGIMPTVGRWIVEELARVCASWAGDPALEALAHLSLNVSPRELWHPALLERLEQLRDVLPSDHTPIIELTESAIEMDPARATATIGSIRELKFRIALDDFGTGYSSLARLRTLPIDIVKIDRSFTHGLVDDNRAQYVVRSLVQLVTGLGMVPLAEGIEDDGAVAFLQTNGCPLGQGFLLGRPMMADRLAAIARAEAASPIDLTSTTR
jgi:diguanylate cyclase (GGDEF)-like protein/PAS domain S-box-containing protein